MKSSRVRSFGFLVGAALVAILVALSVRSASGQPPESPRPAVSGVAPPPSASASASPPAAYPPAPIDRPPVVFDQDALRRAAEPGAQLKVTVLTFSPGDHPFYKFGHNAIWIHDPFRRGPATDLVYNYGTFAFGDPALIPKFFQGRFMYWLSIQTLGMTIPEYREAGRAIYAQELDLTPAEKLELQRRLDENARPENREYKYDYYRDNCATRVRDMIDGAIGGRIKAASEGPARLTYRAHTLRLTESFPAEEVTLNLVMGDFIDKPIKVWDEAFIPMELQKTLRTVTLTNDDGTERPLVKREYTIVETKNPDPPADPPTWWPYALAAGVVLGALMAGLGLAAKKTAVARFAFGGFLSLFGFVFGFLGIFFLAAWAMTDHVVGYHNENVMLCAPWAIAFTGSGIRIALGGKYNKWLAWGYRALVVAVFLYAASATTLSIGVAVLLLLGAASVGLSTNIRLEEKLVRAAAILSLVAVAVKVLPWFDQKNGFFLVFFVPFWLGTAFGIHKIHEKLAADEREASERQAAEEKAKLAAKPDGKKRKKKKTPEGDPSKVEDNPSKDKAPVDAKPAEAAEASEDASPAPADS